MKAIKTKKYMTEIKTIFNETFLKKSYLRNAKAAYYFRLYTNLNLAFGTLYFSASSKEVLRRLRQYLFVVKNLTDTVPFSDEEFYIKTVNEIVVSVLKTKIRLDKETIATLKGKILIAENICIMQIFKINI